MEDRPDTETMRKISEHNDEMWIFHKVRRELELERLKKECDRFGLFDLPDHVYDNLLDLFDDDYDEEMSEALQWRTVVEAYIDNPELFDC